MTKLEIKQMATDAVSVEEFCEAGVLLLIGDNGGFDEVIRNMELAKESDGIDNTEAVEYVKELKLKFNK